LVDQNVLGLFPKNKNVLKGILPKHHRVNNGSEELFCALDRKNEIISNCPFNEDFMVGFWNQLLNECECAISTRIHHLDFEIIIFTSVFNHLD